MLCSKKEILTARSAKNMPDFKLEQPRLSNHLEEILPKYLEDDLMIQQNLIREVSLANGSYTNLVFEKSHFYKVDFSSNFFQRFEVVDCLFESCDFSNIEWIGASFHRCIFKNCKLTGANFAESLLQNCQFIDCNIPYASFNFTQLKRVYFSDCHLDYSEFNDIKWSNFEIHQCHLNKTTWVNTNLNKLNLCSCQFETISLSPDLIRGLIINYEQMITVGLTLGLVLDEPR